MKIHVLFITGMMLALLASAGCTGELNNSVIPVQSSPQGTAAAPDDYSEGLTYTATEPVQHFRSDGSCYRVADVNVINNGATDAENVVIRCNLVDSSTGAVSDTMSRYFEIIESGDHQAFTVELDGACGTGYELKVLISRDVT